MSFDDDTEVELSVVSPFGGRAVDTTTVLVRTPYLVLEGPTRVTKNAPGTWRARVAAASPWNVVFKRRWLVAGAPEDSVVPQGSPNSVTFPVQSSFQLTAELKSTYERKVIAQLQVEATAGQAPRSTREEVRLTQSLDGARTAETRVELSQATNVRVAVYDIRGRERVLLDDGGASQGERVIRWDAHVLEPGVYFVRAATTTGHSATLRFVILR
jgi:hypothetical protein